MTEPSIDPAHDLALDPTLPGAPDLLRWYARHRRRLPWRAEPGETPDPYRVWVSEIMLQQTTVSAAIPHFERFVRRFPSVADLAAAPLDDVMQNWVGLGYYARGRNLHACARQLATLGAFPRTVDGLRALPGIGAYTAAAVAAIAFGVPVVPVDANVERVAARVFAVSQPLPSARRQIAAAAEALGQDAAAQAQPGDFVQALFDLGATVCIPARPRCVVCPWSEPCRARRAGLQEVLPIKAPKPARPTRYGAQFWLQDEAGQVLLRRRPPSGLLGGLLALPGTEWRLEPWAEHEALLHAPQPADWRPHGLARHGFTHFELEMQVYAATVRHITADGVLREIAGVEADLPTAMRRCVAVVRSASTQPGNQAP